MLRNMCAHCDFQPHVTEQPYQRYLKHILEKTTSECERSMFYPSSKFRHDILMGDYSEDVIVDVPISIDGSWQKWYGFNSLLGVVLALSIDTGCVVDYSVKSLICFACKNNKDSSDEWKEAHKLNCSINHEGSSGKMEKDGSVEIFLRSTETRRLRYTTFVGDGDSSSFGAVANAVNRKYGDKYPVEKEDCIGHIQKRLGAALRSYKNKKQGVLLSDGKGVGEGGGGGSERLTDPIIDRMQTAYGYLGGIKVTQRLLAKLSGLYTII